MDNSIYLTTHHHTGERCATIRGGKQHRNVTRSSWTRLGGYCRALNQSVKSGRDDQHLIVIVFLREVRPCK